MSKRTIGILKAIIVVALFIIWLSCAMGASGAETVRSGKGHKFHIAGTNGLTLCLRPANATTVTNAVDCKQCQWAAKKAGAR